MAISHADHGHPNTPAARAACRKRLADGRSPLDVSAERALAEAAGVVRKAADVYVVPRRRGDGGVVKGAKGTGYPANLKRPGTHLRADHDLADVPRMLAYGCRLAWAIDWDVKVGDRFREDEARIEIHGDKGIISLVWRDKRPDGIWKIWVRNFDSSKQYVVESVQEAIALMNHDSDAWDEYGNLKNA